MRAEQSDTDPTGAHAYPQHWEADVLLADGGIVHVRPSGPGDGPAIRDMHHRMSARTRYLRYFSAVGELSDGQLRIYTDVDHRDAVGLVCQIGGELVAAGTYHRDVTGDPGSAEVAFVVADAHQRRGLGSILLEHLAAAAEENGIVRFTAEVLAENGQMVRVFIDAGYTVRREYESGVVDLGFDIAPTEQSTAVVRSRERRGEARSLARLLAPASIAVVGASDDPRALGHAVLANLLRAGAIGGFAGPVYPIAAGRSVQGVRAYGSITDIADEIDLVVVAVSVDPAGSLLDDCAARGVRGIVLMAGVSAAGGGRALARRARAAGMRVLGPNCLGMVNTDPEVRMNATLAPRVPPPGRIGFFCQSGALGIAILADAADRGLGLSTFVSAGNRADVSGNDLLQYWYDDPRTDVVLLYLESFGNPRKFARLARVLARTKPVIAVKSGRHALTTPGLADSSAPISAAAVRTLFEQSGVIRTDTLAAAFDVAHLLSTQPVPRGDRVAVLANSSALGVLAVDACLDAGLRVAAGAPTDLGVAVAAPDLRAALVDAAAGGDVDALIVVYVPPVGTAGREHETAIQDAAAGATIPMVATFLGADGRLGGAGEGAPTPADPGAAEPPPGRTVPCYRTPELAVAALAHAVRYGGWLARAPGEVADPPGVDPDAARALVESWVGPAAASVPPRQLTDAELAALLACYGIAVVDFRVVGSADEAVAAAEALGYPVAVKSFDPALRHRVDRVGVRLGLRTDDTVRAAYDELAAIAGPWLYAQAMTPADRSQVPTVFAVTADPSFGALVSFGIGGVATELLDDRAYRAVPLTDVDAVDLVGAPRAAPLLQGYRGTRPVDTAALAGLALRLSALADDLPEITDLELRPVLAGPGGLAVISGTAHIGPPPARPDARRRLS